MVTVEQLIESAHEAERAGRWADVAALWGAVRAAAPENEGAYTSGARGLRESGRMDEAEALLSDAMARFPNLPNPVSEYAWLATIRRDWSRAVERWAAVRAQVPGKPESFTLAAHALAAQFKHAEADALLLEGVRQLPENAEILEVYATLAYEQGKWPEATERFALVRERFPSSAEGWRGGALTLRNQSRFSDAGHLLEQGMARTPDSPALALEHAMLPTFPIFAADKNWPETLKRMERLRARFPDYVPGWVRGVELLQEAGLSEAAEFLGEKAALKAPDSVELALGYARAAHGRGDWAAAIQRFEAMTERFADFAVGPIGLAETLAAAGRLNDAEVAFVAAIERFPTQSSAFAGYADVAARRGDWAEAAHRWAEAERRFPAEKHLSHRLYEAKMRMMEDAPTPAPRAASVAAPGAVFALAAAVKPDAASIDLRVADLVMQFESLGGRGLGCEFGIFQRDCGAEPLGLLRWADMPFEELVETLGNRFTGVGTEEHTELFVTAVSGGKGEYCTRDRRGMMFMRAFVAEDEMPFDKMLVASCRRIQFLTRKLIEDLETGAKIFVFRLTDRNLTADEITRLHTAVRAYGDNMLLYARYEDEAHPNGTVELAAPGLMIGYMDRFKVSPANEISAAPPTASSLALCRAAHRIWAESN